MFRRTGKFQEALNQFTRVMEQLPEDKTVYIERGLVYQDMSNHKMAIEDFQQAISKDDQCIEAFFHIGTSKLKSNQIKEAIEDFNQAYNLDENIPGILDGLG